jgi:hypothetical protein
MRTWSTLYEEERPLRRLQRLRLVREDGSHNAPSHRSRLTKSADGSIAKDTQPLRSTPRGRHVGLDKMCLLMEVRLQDLGWHRTQRSRFQLRASTTPCRSAQHLGCVHKDALLWMHHRRRREETWHRDSEPGTLDLHQDRLRILAHRAYSEVPMCEG